MDDKLVRLSDVVDAIKTEATRQHKNGAPSGKLHMIDVPMLIQSVNYIPAVDAVEVCRCADCKHWERYVHDRGDDSRCDFHNRQIGRDGYCAWGQRREDGDV